MQGKTLLISLLIAFFLGGLELTIAGTMGNLIACSLHCKNITYFLLFSYLLGSVLGSFSFGYLVDKLGRKRTLEIGLLIFVVSSVLLSFSFLPIMVLSLLFIQGFAIGGDSVAAGPMVIENLTYRGKAFVVLSTTWFLGDFVAAFLGIILTSAFSYEAWRVSFAIAGVLVIPFAIIRFFIKESEVWQKYGKRKVKIGKGVRLLSVLLLVSVIDTIISYAFPFVLLPDFISPYLGFSTIQGVDFVDEAIISATLASIVGGFTVVVFLIDKLKRKTAMIIGHAYMLTAFVLMTLAVLFKSPLGVIIIFGVLSFLSPLGMFAVSLVAIEAFPASIRGKVSGVISGVSSVFSAVTPIIIFSLASKVNVVESTAFLAGLVGVAVASLFSINTISGSESIEEIENAWK
ncbi:MFS transporter [Acidianus sp. HS-5]|uniref:MFS transporter n=1 Tax=Acidianus sp. HS-5 TaxID=2886040 RepID=UPI001F02C0D1|nr:MFS transporter [Acidianus sp. HS-5]BDC18720.1 hypothetical protein HS5_16100 [Acidianus sp. HS-5]